MDMKEPNEGQAMANSCQVVKVKIKINREQLKDISYFKYMDAIIPTEGPF